MIPKQRINSVSSQKIPLTPKITNKELINTPESPKFIMRQKRIGSRKIQNKKMNQQNQFRQDLETAYQNILHRRSKNLTKKQQKNSKKQKHYNYQALELQDKFFGNLYSRKKIQHIQKQNNPKYKQKQQSNLHTNYYSPVPKKSKDLQFSIPQHHKKYFMTPNYSKISKIGFLNQQVPQTFKRSQIQKTLKNKLLQTSLENLHDQILYTEVQNNHPRFQVKRKTLSKVFDHDECILRQKKKQTSLTHYHPISLNKINRTPAFLKRRATQKNTINDFLKIKCLSQSKYGCVQLYVHKSTGFICIIKSINKEKMRQENRIDAIISQIKIQSYLNHPNIVKLLGYFDDTNTVYFIIQYCPHGDLQAFISKQHPTRNQCLNLKSSSIFNQQEGILQILVDIIQGIGYMHRQGILHRDLKPENIVISHGVHKICDFGWSVYASGETRKTFCGTPLYISPQLVEGKEYDEKIDVWGLGIILYELVYGKVPFRMFRATDIMKIIQQQIEYEQIPKYSEKMIYLMKKMLQKNQHKRVTIQQLLRHEIITESLKKRKNSFSL